VVLVTNVAETSLTVPGIHYVIDSGLARISRYNARSQIQHLQIEPIAQASANQRAGRCGRVAPGICVRLYSEEDYQSRPQFTDPEILRTHLASVILKMLSLRLGNIEHFPFIDAPQPAQIRDGMRLLHELLALDDQGRLSALGQRLAQLPIDPRLARMLLAGQDQGALSELLVITSFLAIQDPRELPSDQRTGAQQKHAQDHDPAGDFAVILNLWNRFEAQRQALSQNQFKQYCRREFLNAMRLREWRELHHQLRLVMGRSTLQMNSEPAAIDTVHQAILTGLLSHIGQWKERKTYQMARGKQAVLFPGSVLYRKPPPWLMSFELVETQQLFARMVAPIDPAWCEAAAPHLVKRSYSEPHFAKKRAQVMAWEKVTLFGLVIIGRRRINFGTIDSAQAHELFIREGLVAGHYQSSGAFMAHNQKLLAEVESVEDRVRRRDLRIDDETLVAFYQARIPGNICNGKGFEAWRRKAEATDSTCLFFDPESVWQQPEPNWQEAFPDRLQQGSMRIPLNYRFAPQAPDDGVTAVVPAAALADMTQAGLDWLVPGLLEEKAIALVKALPKPIRRQLVPVPDTVKQALQHIGTQSDQALTDVLSLQLKRLRGVLIKPEDWSTEQLPDHLQVNIRVVDDQGVPLIEGRNLDALRSQIRAPVQTAAATALAQPNVPLTHWPADDLPAKQTLQQAGMEVTVYPTLVDQGDHVLMQYELDAAYSHHLTIRGLSRLGTLLLARQLDELCWPVLKNSNIPLLYAPLGNAQALRNDFYLCLVETALLPDLADLPRTQAAFDAALDRARGVLYEVAEAQVSQWSEWLQLRHDIAQQLKGSMSLERAVIASDIKTQLSRLIAPDRLASAPRRWRVHLTRYLKGMQIRLNRSGIQVHKEQHLISELEDFWQRYVNKADTLAKEGRHSDALVDFRWLIEEYRISIFAQTLGTQERVSSQRLEKYWQEIKSL
jgi:ATP-dependent helicase HrpA